jgi:hypothetical protein
MEIEEPCWILALLQIVVKEGLYPQQVQCELEVEAWVVSVDCQTAAQTSLGQEQTPRLLLDPLLKQVGQLHIAAALHIQVEAVMRKLAGPHEPFAASPMVSSVETLQIGLVQQTGEHIS